MIRWIEAGVLIVLALPSWYVTWLWWVDGGKPGGWRRRGQGKKRWRDEY